MKKEQRASVIEFIGTLSDDDVKYLGCRLVERYAGDLDEAINCLSQTPEIDNILGSAAGADDFFDLCDSIKEVLVKESKRRGIVFYRPSE